MEQLVTLFADIGGSKSREEAQSTATTYQQESYSKDSKDTRDSRESRDFQRDRDTSRSTRDTTWRDPSRRRSTKSIYREATREPWEPKDDREPREHQESRDTKYPPDRKEAKNPFQDDPEPGPPPYSEVADATVQTPVVESNESELAPTHRSGISPTERCVIEAVSTPVDWVIHPSAPHFVICGRCYIDRIYTTQQWRREFVKYTPSTGLSLRCHLGAIPHMEKRWSKVHAADDFLSFLKVMQRKKVAQPCPGHEHPHAPVAWYSTSALPDMRICQECRQRLFGGTVFSKYFSASDPSISSVCHGSFNYTTRMVDQLLEHDDWGRFIDGMRMRIQVSSCSSQPEASIDGSVGWWYKYTKGDVNKNLHVCEACFYDYAYKTDQEGHFVVGDKLTAKHVCMASLKENQRPGTSDIEHGRAEIMRLLHGSDRRCYAQGTVGIKWYTIPNGPREYGVCDGCYQSKIKPMGGGKHFVSKRDVGRHASFACWMNSYHPFFQRHQKALREAIILGDWARLEHAIQKFARVPGCQQGGMGQGKNKRWWGWRSLRICMACMKGGNLADTAAAKKFELHGDKDPYYQVCDLYSMQLRDRFHHEDVGKLLEFARKRQEMMM